MGTAVLRSDSVRSELDSLVDAVTTNFTDFFRENCDFKTVQFSLDAVMNQTCNGSHEAKGFSN